MENIDLILLQLMEQELEYGTVTLQCLKQVYNDYVYFIECGYIVNHYDTYVYL